mmetsp:Transcript_37922/g.118902  ORF Transcript_37922/g.118902 Transcript_37922/m.118902 type:complete len:159 (-) Transcript_37922:1687-2163(-)
MSDFPLPHETVELIVQVLLVVAVVAVFFVVIGILEHRALKSVVGAGAQNVAPTPKPKLKSGPAPTLKLQIDVERKDGDDDVIEETSPLHAGTRESVTITPILTLSLSLTLILTIVLTLGRGAAQQLHPRPQAAVSPGGPSPGGPPQRGLRRHGREGLG